VDLDLIDPTGVFGQVDELQVLEATLEALDGSLPAVDRATIDDPEHATSGAIGLLSHDPGDEGVETDDGDLLALLSRV
jgi:hypothetical protein